MTEIIASNVISADSQSSIICVKIPSPDCTVLAHFEDTKDFHVCVYVLERAGFAIRGNVRASFLNPAAHTPRTASIHATPMRLSSVTTFPSVSQPKTFAQSQLQVTSSAPDDPFSNYSIRRTESVPTQNFRNSFPSFAASQLDVDLNPYNHFAAERANTVASLHDPYSGSTSFSVPSVAATSGNVSSWSLTPTTASEKKNSMSELGLTTFSGTATSSNRAVEDPCADVLYKAADFRQLMPQMRSLPFMQTDRKVEESNTGTKRTAKRKATHSLDSETRIDKDTNSSPPAKSKRPLRKLTEAKRGANRRSQGSQRSKSQSADSHTLANRKGTAAPKRQAQKKSATKPGEETLTPRSGVASEEGKEEENSRSATTKGKHNAKSLPEPASSRKKATAKKSQTQKPATKAKSSTMKKVESTNSCVSTNTTTSKTKTSREDKRRSSAASVGKASGTRAYSQEAINTPAASGKNSIANPSFSNEGQQVTQIESTSTLLITEMGVLEALNRMTSKIMNQYEADLDCGLNRFEISQYYVNSLYNTRFEFWHDKLAKLSSVDSRTNSRPIT
ncbi:hypothetical protein IF1G_03837 [Cordyceps javanica]|uniref:Uncharacterized protein n=1 Tax=Cordyceps javanica TaxID=43265 RepID=A0A545V8N6_9HYPO|nr:hypothetical protein IF1G_03837 [Cordyceps javanica]